MGRLGMRSRCILGTLLSVGVVLFVLGCDDDGGRTTFTLRIENVSPAFEFPASGVFTIPVGTAQPGPIGPGGAYEVTFSAAPGSRLSFATMFVPSNDFFFAPNATGIDLFDANNMPISGDVTSQVLLWDAGTEVNQEPGIGPDQAPLQAAADTGAADPDATVRLAEDTFANLPPVNAVLRVTITAISDTLFTLRIENVSDANTLMSSDGTVQAVPLAPGVWVVHSTDGPLFSVGQPDRGEGLEALAEDGDPSQLGTALASRTGLTVPLAPGVVVIHTVSNPFFTVGAPDRSEGLEALAEDGDPTQLQASLENQSGIESSVIFNTPVGATMPAAIGPGGAYDVTLIAAPGDRLSFATMFVVSNDFFFAPDGDGLALFNQDGTPVSGDLTASVLLWDAGTEVNQEPGVGPDQAPYQPAPDTGAADADATVRLAEDTFNNLPPTTQVIRVTITP